MTIRYSFAQLARLAALTLLMAVFLCPSWHPPAIEPDGAGGAAADSVQPTALKARWLEPGVAVERRLGAGEVHAYRLDMKSGQCMKAVVEQRGIDVAVLIFGTDGKYLVAFDSPTGAEGRERPLLVAPASGTYRLEIRSVYGASAGGRYRLEITHLSPATPRDRKDFQAFSILHVPAASLGRDSGDGNSTAEAQRHFIKQLQRALAYWKSRGSESGAYAIRNAIVQTYEMLGEPERALQVLRQALTNGSGPRTPQQSLFEEGWEPWPWDDPWSVRSNLYLQIGELYRHLGDPERALDYCRWSLLLSERALRPRWSGESLNCLARAHLELAEPEAALEVLGKERQVWRAEGQLARVARSWDWTAKAYEALGERGKALKAYSQALPLRRASEQYFRLDAAFHVGFGRLLLAMGFRSEAQQHLAKIREDVPLHGEALIELSQIYSAMGMHREGSDLFRRHLRQGRQRGDARVEQMMLHGLARLACDSGQLGEARDWSERSLQVGERLRSNLHSPLLRARFWAQQQRYYEFHVDLLMRLGEEVAAFQAWDGARARKLLDALSRPAEEGRLPEPRAQVELSGRLEASLSNVIRRHHLGVSLKPLAAQKETLLFTDLLSWSHELRGAARLPPLRQATLQHPQRANSGQIQRALDDDTLILEYALGEQRSFLWAVDCKRIEGFELPARAKIESVAQRVYDLLAARGRNLSFETADEKLRRVERAERQFPQAAAELSRMLLAPVAHLLKGQRLIIVGDGILHYIPFGVLPLPAAAEPGHGLKGAYLPTLARHEVAVAPSAAVPLLLNQRRTRLIGPTLAVFADPVFRTTDPRLGKAATAASSPEPASVPDPEGMSEVERSARDLGLGAFERLPASREEAQAIASLLPRGEAFTALGLAARRDRVLKGGLRNFRILHFATHSVLNEKHPELSGIVLSLVDEQGMPLNGLLSVHDLHQLDLRADLVVLSACRTALGKQIRGEGLWSLAQGFLEAGVPAVVSGLWSPQDRATAELMTRFYRGLLAEGLPPSAALRRAQLSMWQQERWRSPYFWGGFVLQGDWRVPSPASGQ